jgi:hypothetical protein
MSGKVSRLAFAGRSLEPKQQGDRAWRRAPIMR